MIPSSSKGDLIMAANRMGRSANELVENRLWSGSLFVNHFSLLLLEIDNNRLKFGRTVLHISGKMSDKTYKLYPRYNGKSNEYVTLTIDGEELVSFHYTELPSQVVSDTINIVDRSE